MTNLHLDPPDFKQPDEWCRWKRRFEKFRLVSGRLSEGEHRQVYALLYSMEVGAEDTLASTGISSEYRKKYQAVMAKFDTIFKARKNVIFERACFNHQRQGENESIEQAVGHPD